MSALRKVGIIGAGTMGRRIAFGCVIRDITARLYDIAPGVGEAALTGVRRMIEARVTAGQVPERTLDTAMQLVTTSPSIEACVSGADLAIETVSESVELKRKVFAEIDRYAPPALLIGTNTSSIPGSLLADATQRPAQVFNFNFGHVDHPKVEVMAHPGTAKATMQAAVDFVRSMDLVPIVVRREIVGYGLNRVWRAVKKEVLHLIDGGYLGHEDIDRGWMLDWHVSVGPCGLMDKIGLDVVRDIENIYFKESGDIADKPPKLLDDMIAAGKLGEKAGEGFYTYPNPAYELPGWLRGGAQ